MQKVGNWGGGNVWKITSGIFSSNAYVIEAGIPGGCILIDPGLDALAIDAELIKVNKRPAQIFCTHGHFDHVGGAHFFQKKYGCPVFMHEADKKTLKSSNFLLMILKIPQKITIPEVTYVNNNFCIPVNGVDLKYIPTPGHTPGSCVINFGSAWFTGDTIYSRGIGLSSLPGECPETLKQSILSLWDRLTVEIMIYPGHGGVADGLAIRTQNKSLINFLGMVP